MSELAIRDEAIKRIGLMSFGDEVTNVCAGAGNPTRYGYFVEHVRLNKKTFGGFPYTEHWAKCTDRKGKFWKTDIKVVYPGRIDDDECKRLFAPIWESEFGNVQTQSPTAKE